MNYGVEIKAGAFVAFAVFEGKIYRRCFCSTRTEAEKKIEEWKTPNW